MRVNISIPLLKKVGFLYCNHVKVPFLHLIADIPVSHIRIWMVVGVAVTREQKSQDGN